MLSLKNCILLTSISSLSFSAWSAYTIERCDQLINLSNMQGEYNLITDLDCKDYNFRPIEGVFSGVLNGNGFTISNLKIINEKEEKNLDTGLFRAIESAIITDITFIKAKVVSNEGAYRGLIAGKAYGSTTDASVIQNINVDRLEIINDDGDKPRTGSSGGIVGYANHTHLDNVHLYSSNNDGVIKINKHRYGGGLIGVADTGVVINEASVSHLKIFPSYCGEINESCAAGGLIGNIGDTGANEIFQSTVSDVIIKQSSASGRMEIESNAGGLVGLIDDYKTLHIQDSYSNITFERVIRNIGGLIGKIELDHHHAHYPIILQNVFSISNIDENLSSCLENCRGIVGGSKKNTDDGLDSRVIGANSHFDNEKNIGNKDKNPGDNISEGLTTYEMQSSETFHQVNTGNNEYDTPWHSDVWHIEDGSYPTLK